MKFGMLVFLVLAGQGAFAESAAITSCFIDNRYSGNLQNGGSGIWEDLQATDIYAREFFVGNSEQKPLSIAITIGEEFIPEFGRLIQYEVRENGVLKSKGFSNNFIDITGVIDGQELSVGVACKRKN